MRWSTVKRAYLGNDTAAERRMQLALYLSALRAAAALLWDSHCLAFCCCWDNDAARSRTQQHIVGLQDDRQFIRWPAG